jgi:hypothetical protein
MTTHTQVSVKTFKGTGYHANLSTPNNFTLSTSVGNIPWISKIQFRITGSYPCINICKLKLRHG